MNGTSSLGYPFATKGGGGGMVSAVRGAALQAVTFPWTLTLGWLSWWAGLLLRALTALGAPPLGYLPQAKLQELDSIVNHMHTREDLFRRAIKELQEEVDAKEHKTKAAVRKLKATKEEIATLTDRLAALQEQYTPAGGGDTGGGPAAGGSGSGSGAGAGGAVGRVTMHATMGAAAAGVWWFCQSEHPALHWKLVFILFFPLLWWYLSWAGSGRRGAAPPGPLLCGAWFLIGYVSAHTVGGDRNFHALP